MEQIQQNKIMEVMIMLRVMRMANVFGLMLSMISVSYVSRGFILMGASVLQLMQIARNSTLAQASATNATSDTAYRNNHPNHASYKNKRMHIVRQWTKSRISVYNVTMVTV